MIGAAEIFTLFFVMLGPLKVLGPFAQRTRGLDAALVRRIAWYAFFIATTAVVLGSLLGQAMIAKWHVSHAALLLAAGIVFFLVALRQLLEQYDPLHASPELLPPSPLLAANRLVEYRKFKRPFPLRLFHRPRPSTLCHPAPAGARAWVYSFRPAPEYRKFEDVSQVLIIV